MKQVFIATSNRGKLRDFAGAAAPHEIEIVPIPNFASLTPVVEDGQTFEENARKKAEQYSRALPGQLVLADDSGLRWMLCRARPGSTRRATLQQSRTKLARTPMTRRTTPGFCANSRGFPRSAVRGGSCA